MLKYHYLQVAARIYIYIILLGCPGILFADNNTYVFLGTIVPDGGVAYSYKLVLDDSDGNLSGYSLTDLLGPNETKTAVVGTVNKLKKQMDFRETHLVYTRAKLQAKDFCFLKCHVKLTNDGTKLKGSFTAFDNLGKNTCGSGKLHLIAAKVLLEKLMKMVGADSTTALSIDTLKASNTTVKLDDADKNVTADKVKSVQPGNTTELNCPTGTALIQIWDAKTVDGDKISVYQDGVPLLKEYTITNHPKLLTVKLNDNKKSVLKIVANNEGYELLNTARIKIASGSEVYYIDATTTIGKNVTVILTRK